MSELKRKQEDEDEVAAKVAKTGDVVSINEEIAVAESLKESPEPGAASVEVEADKPKEAAAAPETAASAPAAEPKKTARSKYADLEGDSEDSEDSEDDEDFDEGEFDDDLDEEEELSEVEVEEGSRRRTRVDYKKVLEEMEKEEAANLQDDDDNEFVAKE
ncbi:hypothetical protein B9G98_00221 [Wickerhamiella sorbophila]|uniref:Histone H2A.Z-specific chaperone chz1 n=1 Tax=Wickerhamiella sorbophila TaxID=45607 RepID=A0A2T0FC95_9ASCO|nr:hypothetical protein B9G98_00221 [Wickerhamiella sorbophila]PRT52601.1 hypothetical protein B9G98_00221 [Wickerhamiella sorbophila]